MTCITGSKKIPYEQKSAGKVAFIWKMTPPGGLFIRKMLRNFVHYLETQEAIGMQWVQNGTRD